VPRDRDPRDLAGLMAEWESQIERAKAAQARHYAEHPERAPDDDGTLDAHQSREAALAATFAELVPRAYDDPRLDQFPAKVRGVVEPWAHDPHGTLMITGPVGTGKTHLGWAAVRSTWMKGRRMWAGTAAALVLALRPDASQAYRRTWDRIIHADLVYLDDLGAERQTEWSADQIAQVIHERWEHNRPMIITTNLRPRRKDGETGGDLTLQDHLGERTYSRLTADTTAVRLTGTDRRRNRP
jgi:DNA replication protein DnaC